MIQLINQDSVKLLITEMFNGFGKLTGGSMWPTNCSIIRHYPKFQAGLTLVLVTFGCNTVSSDEVGKSALARKIAGFVEVVEFEITDERIMEVFGVNGYRMELRAEVRNILSLKDLDARYKGGDPMISIHQTCNLPTSEPMPTHSEAL